MGKEYKVSYKTYYNDRLKEVDFHGKKTYPLYLQITYERKSIVFKSYYFDLLSHVRYDRHIVGKRSKPTLSEIETLEIQLIEFIIEKNRGSFSLDIFRQDYAYYSRDLCTLTAHDFGVYLFFFFNKKELSALGSAIASYQGLHPLYEVIDELKLSLLPELHQELIAESFPYGHFGAPYLLLSGFMQQIKTPPLLIFTVKEWDRADTKEKFATYLQNQYPNREPAELLGLINKRLDVLRKEGQ